MARTIAAITEPMQLHAECFQILDGSRVLRMTAQQADSGKAKTLARRRQCVQMVGIGAAEADNAAGACPLRLGQVLGELEPLVATDQRVDAVQAQHGQLDAVEPIQC